MSECRYYGLCSKVDSRVSCDGSGMVRVRIYNYYQGETSCPLFEPMADHEALLALANEMEQAGKDYRYQMVENACCDNLINDGPDNFIDFAARIREALGAGDV